MILISIYLYIYICITDVSYGMSYEYLIYQTYQMAVRWQSDGSVSLRLMDSELQDLEKTRRNIPTIQLRDLNAEANRPRAAVVEGCRASGVTFKTCWALERKLQKNEFACLKLFEHVVYSIYGHLKGGPVIQ